MTDSLEQPSLLKPVPSCATGNASATPFQHDLYTKLAQAEARVQQLEQENARLKEELEQHGAGKCCTIGKTITRPEFHIDPDDY